MFIPFLCIIINAITSSVYASYCFILGSIKPIKMIYYVQTWFYSHNSISHRLLSAASANYFTMGIFRNMSLRLEREYCS